MRIFNKQEFLQKIENLLNEEGRDLGDHNSAVDALAWFSAWCQAEAFRETNSSKDIARMIYYGVNWQGTKTFTTIEEVMVDYVGEMLGLTDIEEFLDDDEEFDTIEDLFNTLDEFYPVKEPAEDA